MIAERGKARAGNLGHPFVAWIGNNLEQFSNSFASDWSDNAEFGNLLRYRNMRAFPVSEMGQEATWRLSLASSTLPSKMG